MSYGSNEAGKGECSQAERKASMNVEKAPSKNLNSGSIGPSQTNKDIGSKASGSMGYRDFDLGK